MAFLYFRCGTGMTTYDVSSTSAETDVSLTVDNTTYDSSHRRSGNKWIKFDSLEPKEGYGAPYKIWIYKDADETQYDNSWTLTSSGDHEVTGKTYDRYVYIEATKLGKNITIYKGAGINELYGTPYRNGVAGTRTAIDTTGTTFTGIPTGAYRNNYVLLDGVTYYSGYTNAWYYNTSGDKTYVSDDPQISMFTADRSVSIYSEQETTTFTLKYDANGGSGAPADQTIQSSTGSATFTISSTVPSRDGYAFQGWADSSSATTAQYQPGGSLYTTATVKTIYAVWTKSLGLFYWDGAEGNEDINIFWDIANNKGQPVTNLTKNNWNRFKAKVKSVVKIIEGEDWTYSDYSSFSATDFNNVYDGINKLTHRGSLPAKVSAGSIIKAKYFVSINSSANLRDALNTAITYWNTH